MRSSRRWVAVVAAVAVVALTVGGVAAAGSKKPKFDGTIKIGSNGAQSGVDQSFGRGVSAGIQLAIDDINKAGGVEVGGKKYKLELVIADNRSDPTGVVSAAETLAAEKVFAAAAPNTNFSAAYAVMQPAGMLVFGGTPQIALNLLGQRAANPALFSVIPFSVLVFTKWIPQIKALFPEITKIGILIEDEAVATPLVASIRNAAGPNGMEVVAVERFPLGTTDFTTQLTRIRDAKPDVVLTGRLPVHNVPANQQAAQLDVAPYIWTFTGIPSDLGDLSKFDGKTLIFSHFAQTLGKGATIPALKKAAKRLSKLDDDILPETVMPTYNFVQLLVQGIEKAGTITDPAAVATAMENLTYSGVFGSSRIDPGRFQDHPTFQIVYKDKKTTVNVYDSINNVEPDDEIVVKK